MSFQRAIVTLLGLALAWASAGAAQVQVAVASNFAAPMQRIAQAFAQATGHQAVLSVGSSGKFFAQIQNGAPFALLLSADQDVPQRLVAAGLALPETRWTYAVGHLVLWSPQPGLVDAQGQVLQRPLPGKLAWADPRLAPYGLAAQQVVARLGLTERLRPHAVQGENIAQTFQFVRSGNAALGFVALSQVLQDGQPLAGSLWRVPADLHAPIRQDAVLLRAGAGQPAAQALVAFLRGPQVRQIIEQHGYTVPAPP